MTNVLILESEKMTRFVDWHDDFDIEERILPCERPHCSNLLKIHIYLCKEDQKDDPFFKKGSPRYIEAILKHEYGWVSGACLGYSRPPGLPRGGRRPQPEALFKQGPVQVGTVKMIACRRCFRRVRWEKLKKVHI